MTDAPTLSPASPRRAERGVSLVEVLIGGVILSVALLGHVASTLTEHRLAEDQAERSEVLHLARQFMERLRADDDWNGLYLRLRGRQLASVAGTPIADRPSLHDGTPAYSPIDYYPDFTIPPGFESFGVLVRVPGGGPDGAPQTALREDLLAPRFGLPGDLDGDAAVGTTAVNDTYLALPVEVTFTWQPPGEATRELRTTTWLRGNR